MNAIDNIAKLFEPDFDFANMSHNVPGSLLDNPGKLDRCVRSVEAQNRKGKDYNPWAVCNASIGKRKK